MTKQLGKIQPQNVDIEAAVLGAVLLERDALNEIVDILKPESFYNPSNSLVFAAILDLFHSNSPIDILTVKDQLQKNGHLEQCGGAFYIADLTTKINSAANIEYHARVLAESAMKRACIRVSADLQAKAFEDTEDVFEIVGEADTKLNQIINDNTKGHFETFGAVAKEAYEKMLKLGGEELSGVPSGFEELDKITGGWQETDLIVIAARPAMGKTAFVVSALANAAIRFNEPVGIFSLEMSAGQLVQRVISGESEIHLQNIMRGRLREEELTRYNDQFTRLQNLPLFIDDTASLSILELRAKARRLKRNHGIKLLVVDYLQLMQGDMKAKGNREQEIASISRGLKALAKELEIPVIALSQLSRAVEARGGDKKPMLADLRESGAIEQDADMVCFLYRPEYYGFEEDEDGLPVKDIGQVIIAKHRSGALDNVNLKFLGKYTKWTNLDILGSESYSSQFPASDVSSFESESNIRKGDAPF